ncbi:MAG: hypothetical protein Q7S49_00970 [bacterium]|nr:hypothetical protein [bacterium]
MKIVSSGKVLNSREFYEKKKRRRRIQLILLSIGFLAILFSLVYLSRQERFLINEITVQGENVIDKEEIAQAAQRLLAGYYIWVIPRANTIIYPRRAIKQSLIEKFPRLKSVGLNLGDHQKLLITVEEHVPFALYCIYDCFFLDEEGLIFALAPSFSGEVYFVYTTKDQIQNPIGKRFLSTEEFKSLSRFIETLTTFNIRSLSLEMGNNEFTITISKGGQIIWRRDSDLALIESNLEAFLSDNSIRAQENFLDRILYLDLRTENKVFYKFRD